MTGPLVGNNVPPHAGLPGIPPNIVRTAVGIPKSKPGGFLRRAAAIMIDGLILGIALFPLKMLAAVIGGALQGNNLKTAALAPGLIIILFSFLLQILATYFYFGYFYSTRGATPGKALFGLKVLDAKTGTYLTYGQSFLREVVGKIIDAMTLGIGYLMVLFRDDKKALHDIIFNTQVIRKED